MKRTFSPENGTKQREFDSGHWDRALLFVRRELMDVETAQGMLAWPHSGFHVHDGVWAAADDRAFAVRLARYCSNLRNWKPKDTVFRPVAVPENTPRILDPV